MVTKQQGVLLALWLALALILRFVCTACDYLAYSIVFGVLVWAAYRALRYLAATKARLARHLRRALSLLLALCAVWFLGTEVYLISGAQTDDTTPCQYIVVLGAQVRGTQPSPRHAGPDRRRSRLSFCAPDVICIVSGGQGPGEKITEAACMRRLLLDAGIPGTRIWLEPKASDTAENLANSLALIEAQTGTRPDRLGIVSSEYHLRRAQLVASRQGCQGVASPAADDVLSICRSIISSARPLASGIIGFLSNWNIYETQLKEAHHARRDPAGRHSPAQGYSSPAAELRSIHPRRRTALWTPQKRSQKRRCRRRNRSLSAIFSSTPTAFMRRHPLPISE